MVLKKRTVERIITAGGTFLAALAIGYFMQNGDRIRQGFALPEDGAGAESAVETAAAAAGGSSVVMAAASQGE